MHSSVPNGRASQDKYTWVKFCPLCKSNNCKPIHAEKNDFGKLASDPAVAPYAHDVANLLSCETCKFAFVDRFPSEMSFYEKVYAEASFVNAEADFRYSGKR